MSARTAPVPSTLAVCLHGRRIGVITRLAGDRHLFAFEESYADDPARPTLSLGFKSESGGLVQEIRAYRVRVDATVEAWRGHEAKAMLPDGIRGAVDRHLADAAERTLGYRR